jgi:hypothetical protein
VINTSRSERGWRGRRRIAVLVSIAGVLGIAALGSATTASAATVANCNAKLEPVHKSKTKAKLSFVCDSAIRSYTIGATGRIKNYSGPRAGTANAFLSCEGLGAGFGCGVDNRSDPGSQAPGTTGWNTTTPGASTSATANPTTCHGFKRTEGSTSAGIPNKNTVVTGACTQQIAAGTKVAQDITLGASPCGRNSVKLFLMVGGEPDVTSFLAPGTGGGGGESTTVGEYLQAPTKVNMKAYKNCVTSDEAKAKKGAKKSAAPATKYPVSCSGSVTPFKGVRGPDVDLAFTCSQNVRAFAVYSNVQIDLPGDEPIVTGNNGGQVNESANHQCEGDLPSFGYGCGTVDRQTTTASSATNPNLPNGNTISAGNTANQKMGFDSTPCTRKGEPKPKVWLVVMGEPTIGGAVGEFSSQPFPLAVSGFGKCGGGKKKK